MSREKVRQQFLKYAVKCATVIVDENVPFSVFLPSICYEISRYCDIDYPEIFNLAGSLYYSDNNFKKNLNKIVREVMKTYYPNEYKEKENALKGHLFNVFSKILYNTYTLYFCPTLAFLDIKIDFGEKYDIDSCFRASGCNHHHFIILDERLKGAEAFYIGIEDNDNNVGRFWTVRTESGNYILFNVYGDYESVWNVVLPFTLAVRNLEKKEYVFGIVNKGLSVYTNNGKVAVVYSQISASPYEIIDEIIEDIEIECDLCGQSYSFDEQFQSVYYRGDSHIVCEDCASEFVRCEVCEEMYHQDEVVWLDDRAYCETCAEGRIVYCSVCDEAMRADDAYYDHYGNCYCEDCLYENTFACEKCDETFPIDEIIRIYYSDNTSEHLCPHCAAFRLGMTVTEVRNLLKEEIHDLFECVGCGQFVPEHQIENELCPQCREEVKEVVNE